MESNFTDFQLTWIVQISLNVLKTRGIKKSPHFFNCSQRWNTPLDLCDSVTENQ